MIIETDHLCLFCKLLRQLWPCLTVVPPCPVGTETRTRLLYAPAMRKSFMRKAFILQHHSLRHGKPLKLPSAGTLGTRKPELLLLQWIKLVSDHGRSDLRGARCFKLFVVVENPIVSTSSSARREMSLPMRGCHIYPFAHFDARIGRNGRTHSVARQSVEHPLLDRLPWGTRVDEDDG